MTERGPLWCRAASWLRSDQNGWSDDPLSVAVKPEVPNYAKRRFWLSKTFPGETLIIPSGSTKVRAK
jgi:Xaa-Pro aminopeptidase